MSRRRLLGVLLVACAAGCDAPPGAPIVGHAVLAGLTDHAGTRVFLAGHDEIAASTDVYGYFALPDVPAGDYQVIAERNGTAERQVVVAVRHDGEHPTTAHLVLTPFGRVEGSVSDVDRLPVAFATVRVLGTDVSATTGPDGAYAIDPAPAGALSLTASVAHFEPGFAEAVVPVGDTVTVAIALGPDTGHGPYDLNRPPEISPLGLAGLVSLEFPQVIPLVDTGDGRVRRAGRYRLSVSATDPDGDPLTVFFSADRGTLESAQGSFDPTDATYATTWIAGGGVASLSCTVLDPYGGSATRRLVVEASGDNIRSAGRFGNTVYYGERRGETYDLYGFDFVTGQETVVAGGDLEQHAVVVVDQHLVHADSEFVFIGSLVYRGLSHDLVSGERHGFGQTFDHDAFFVVQFDLYTPVTTPWLPYSSSDAAIAPPGFGLIDLHTGDAVQPSAFLGAPAPPANLRSFSRADGRDVWMSGDGQIWSSSGGPATSIASLGVPAVLVSDLQTHGGRAAVLPETLGPLYWLDLDGGGLVHEEGYAVTSFALHGDHLVYIEQGPSAASVEYVDLASGGRRTLSTTPHFARRIWHLDDAYVIWGDQGSEGQAFVALNTELLWIDAL